jgi:hypothetical protein
VFHTFTFSVLLFEVAALASASLSLAAPPTIWMLANVAANGASAATLNGVLKAASAALAR